MEQPEPYEPTDPQSVDDNQREEEARKDNSTRQAMSAKLQRIVYELRRTVTLCDDLQLPEYAERINAIITDLTESRDRLNELTS